MYDKNKMAICKHSSYFHSLFALLSITAYTQGKISQFKENSISPMVVEKLFYGLDMIKEHRRVVRSAGSGDSNQPTSTNREFDNPNHNQAVLHWSGKKSDVSMLSYLMLCFKVKSMLLYKCSYLERLFLTWMYTVHGCH